MKVDPCSGQLEFKDVKEDDWKTLLEFCMACQEALESVALNTYLELETKDKNKILFISNEQIYNHVFHYERVISHDGENTQRGLMISVRPPAHYNS